MALSPSLPAPASMDPFASPEPARTVRRDGLDVLRAVAILSVLAFHAPANAREALPAWVRAGFGQGWIGVDLFFVLSGYLIGRQVFGPEEPGGLGANLRTFWTKRWMRTLPLYFIVLAAYALKPWVFGTPFVGGGWHYALFLQNFTDLRDFEQSWSLCVEEHFYLLLPLAAFGLGGRRWPAPTWLVPIAVSLLLRFFARSTLPEGLDASEVWVRLQWPTFQHLDGLCAGVFLARTAPTWQRWPARARALCGVLGLATVVAMLGVCVPRLQQLGGVWLITGLAVGFSGLLVAMESLRLPTAVRWPVYQVSALSYGAYLWFGPIVRVFERRGIAGPPALTLLAFLAATLAVSWVTYQAVEQPCLRLRDRLLARFKEARRSVTALGG
ncbi:acyltransferase [Corallococcus sp. BB11-1]|uniref:acyltransferase family protein n=1 Tax=Corallococcus sp. BB11-1 TaxID=2996783 RepID=UPI0022714B66|nr:acyltransferase [Corallococcus sp. BB11-1]MCY1036340.1 acyltransferase [Corallococcus sp. BB11-1]